MQPVRLRASTLLAVVGHWLVNAGAEFARLCPSLTPILAAQELIAQDLSVVFVEPGPLGMQSRLRDDA